MFSLRFCLKFNASACLNFPTVVATCLYSFQKRDLAYFSHNIFRFRPVPSRSQSRVTFVSVCRRKFRSMLLGSGQPVPESINFLHTALLRQHYANHFPESLTWSYLQFSPPASPKDRQHFLLAAAWTIHLQLLTLNQRLATVLPSRSSAPLAIPPISAPVRTASTSSSVTITPAR